MPCLRSRHIGGKMELPKLSLKDLARSGHVTRWHSVNTQRKQTLAEHHYMVNRIAVKLARNIIGSGNMTVADLFDMSEYALSHDSHEILMGDMPSPLKRHIERICGENNPIEQIENEIAPWIAEMKLRLRRNAPELLLIVKLADIIDALVFISVEGIGKHAEKVIQLLHSMLEDKLVEAKNSYPGFSWEYTLDLLNELMENDEAGKIMFELKADPQ